MAITRRIVLTLILGLACRSAHATIRYDWTFDGSANQTTNMPEAVSGTNTLTASGNGSIDTTGSDRIVGSGVFARPAQSTNSDVLNFAGNINPSASYTITAWIKTSQANYPNILSWTSPANGATPF